MYENITIDIALHYFESFGIAFACNGDTKTVVAEEE